MKYLLDTHAIVWFLMDDADLSERARVIIDDPGTSIDVSAASLWEMSIKFHAGKWPKLAELFPDPTVFIARAGFGLLDMTPEDGVAAGAIEIPDPRHKDPFDRMLIAQARRRDLTIITRDRRFDAYGGRVVW